MIVSDQIVQLVSKSLQSVKVDSMSSASSAGALEIEWFVVRGALGIGQQALSFFRLFSKSEWRHDGHDHSQNQATQTPTPTVPAAFIPFWATNAISLYVSEVQPGREYLLAGFNVELRGSGVEGGVQFS